MHFAGTPKNSSGNTISKQAKNITVERGARGGSTPASAATPRVSTPVNTLQSLHLSPVNTKRFFVGSLRRSLRQNLNIFGSYGLRPEKSYYLETQQADGATKELPHNSVKKMLHCRTVGLCSAHNRLLNYRVVRSTRPVVWVPCSFAPPREKSTPRSPAHLERLPDYAHPQFYLSATQAYFFRHESLRGLRIEQFNRYFLSVRDHARDDEETLENVADDEDDDVQAETWHRHFDSAAEEIAPGTSFASACRVEGVRRRKSARLAVSRLPFIEPIGKSREDG